MEWQCANSSKIAASHHQVSATQPHRLWWWRRCAAWVHPPPLPSICVFPTEAGNDAFLTQISWNFCRMSPTISKCNYPALCVKTERNTIPHMAADYTEGAQIETGSVLVMEFHHGDGCLVHVNIFKLKWNVIIQPLTNQPPITLSHVISKRSLFGQASFFCVDLNPRRTSILVVDSGALCGQKRYCFHHLQYNVAGGIRISLSVCCSPHVKCLIVTWLVCQSIQPRVKV